MKLKQFFCVGLFGLALTSFVPETGFAQNLKVTNQSTARKLNVAINSAVVVESDVPFAELSVANPAIADIATLSDRTIYVLGKSPGRTTLTLLGPDGRLITNVSVRVSPDLSEFKERLREILRGVASSCQGQCLRRGQREDARDRRHHDNGVQPDHL